MEAATQLLILCGVLHGPRQGISCAADSYFPPIDNNLIFRSSLVKCPAHIFLFHTFFLTQGDTWSQDIIFSLAE